MPELPGAHTAFSGRESAVFQSSQCSAGVSGLQKHCPAELCAAGHCAGQHHLQGFTFHT